jgi:hypothetical protein
VPSALNSPSEHADEAFCRIDVNTVSEAELAPSVINNMVL